MILQVNASVKDIGLTGQRRAGVSLLAGKASLQLCASFHSVLDQRQDYVILCVRQHIAQVLLDATRKLVRSLFCARLQICPRMHCLQCQEFPTVKHRILKP